MYQRMKYELVKSTLEQDSTADIINRSAKQIFNLLNYIKT